MGSVSDLVIWIFEWNRSKFISEQIQIFWQRQGTNQVEMVLSVLKGEPLVTKLAVVAKYGVLPVAMLAAVVYSPPDYARPKNPSPTSSSQ